MSDRQNKGSSNKNSGRGRGNFGNPEQHAEAGRQSSGNRSGGQKEE